MAESSLIDLVRLIQSKILERYGVKFAILIAQQTFDGYDLSIQQAREIRDGLSDELGLSYRYEMPFESHNPSHFSGCSCLNDEFYVSVSTFAGKGVERDEEDTTSRDSS